MKKITKQIAWVGGVSHKKGPMLFLQAAKTIVDWDDEYTFHVAGAIQDPRYEQYFHHMIEKMGLTENVFFYGKLPHKMIPEFLADKSYILSTSPWESHQFAVSEALSMGLLPLVHNWEGCPYPYSWDAVSELPGLLREHNGEFFKRSKECKELIAAQFDLQDKHKLIDDVLILANKEHDKPKVGVAMMARAGDPLLRKAIETAIPYFDGIYVCLDVRKDGIPGWIEGLDGVHVKACQPVMYTEECIDFSCFRNETLEFAKEGGMDWAFILDSDEFIEAGGEEINTTALIAHYLPDVDCVMIGLNCYTEKGLIEQSTSARMFRLDRDIHYLYPIHNQIRNNKGGMTNQNIAIHSSYDGTLGAHIQRSLPALLKLHQEGSDEQDEAKVKHASFYIFRSYIGLKDMDNMLKWGRDYLSRWGKDNASGGVYSHMINALLAQGKTDDAMETMREGLAAHPNHPDLNHIAMTQHALKYYQGSIDPRSKYSGLPSNTSKHAGNIKEAAKLLGMPIQFQEEK